MSHLDGILDDFHRQVLWGPLFLALVLGAGEPVVSLGPLSVDLHG